MVAFRAWAVMGESPLAGQWVWNPAARGGSPITAHALNATMPLDLSHAPQTQNFSKSGHWRQPLNSSNSDSNSKRGQ